MQLTINEKKLLLKLEKAGEESPEYFGDLLSKPAESVIQYANLLSQKGLAEVKRELSIHYIRTEEGEKSLREGLPERQLYNSFDKSVSITELNRHQHAKIGIGWMKRLGWISIADGVISKISDAPESSVEKGLMEPDKSPAEVVKELLRRDLVATREDISWKIQITPEGISFVEAGLDLREEVGTLTSDQISSGGWKDLTLRRYDIGKRPRPVWPGKIHPYQRMIDEMRRILLDMGFTELYGGIIQGAFWNFDALFQPQDHPAREMQDTFHLAQKMDLPPGWERVREMHENGGDTGSTGWGTRWDPDKARATVLRTHTTSLSIQHLAEHKDPPVKAFCVGRVYRRESIDPTHLPEFEQLEGIVMDKDVSFKNLLGYLKEFYGRMGFSSVRFRPGYFPYTEPSVEPEVFIEELGWVELGGAGIFREEVTAPWGITCPVLAWGLGVSRVAMLRMGLSDLRELYQSDIDWIRKVPVMHGGHA